MSNAPKASGMFSRLREQGLTRTLHTHLDQVKRGGKFWEEAGKDVRHVAFARIAGTTVGAAIAVQALRSKTNDGEERAPLSQFVEFVAGSAIAATSVLAGRA